MNISPSLRNAFRKASHSFHSSVPFRPPGNSYHIQTERFENLLNYYYTFMYLFQWLLDFLLLLVNERSEGNSPL